eukprot:XP_003725085.1 PREDICTED: contactin-4 [Strongylocentrotus purpuratus]
MAFINEIDVPTDFFPETSPYDAMPDIHISTQGIVKMLEKSKVRKATGPDGIPALLLRKLSRVLKYWSDDSNEANANTAVSLGVGTSNTITGLEPSTRYTVMVAAYSGGGNGPDSNTASDTTFKSAPMQKPTGVRAVQSETGGDLTVNWNGITTSASEEPLMGYKVRYRTEGTFAPDAVTIVVQGNENTKAIIRGLTYETTYLITVVGYSDGGNGVSSNPPLSVTIAKGRTRQPSDDPNGASRTAGVLSFSLFCVVTLLNSLSHLL